MLRLLATVLDGSRNRASRLDHPRIVGCWKLVKVAKKAKKSTSKKKARSRKEPTHRSRKSATAKAIPAPTVEPCCFPGCSSFGQDEHHVTYEPEVIKRLCREHHEQITIINGQQARKYRRGLSNRHRWWIWFQWRLGKLKARRTQKALEYIEDWEQPSN